MSSFIESPGALPGALAKVRRRLIPFLFLLYIVAYLDRINVGFAALQMNDALGFTPTTFGLGAGIFFAGYALFEIPSNVILARVGARLWIARIMISWGIVSSAMMFVRTPQAFYTLRFLLGSAEAGFFPGVIYYLTHWVPERQRARMLASFMTAAIMAGVVGGPISGALLSFGGAAGLHGWQWLFLLEGVPATVLGTVVLRVLTDAPQEAAWLTAAERDAIVQSVSLGRSGSEIHSAAVALTSGRTWLLAVGYFAIPVALYGIGFWLPQMLKAAAPADAGDFRIGVLAAIPYACGAIAMVVVGRHSDRSGERRWHLFAMAVVAAAGLVMTPFGSGTAWVVVTLSIAMLGLASMLGPFWAFATSAIRGVGAAAAIALINSVGNTGGFAGPYMLGAIADATHSYQAGLFAIAGILLAGAALVLAVKDDR